MPSDSPDSAPHDLKKRTARGVVVSIAAQGSSMVLRMGSMVVLARLVAKEEFGLLNMVTALTGVLFLFRDLGLSMATVQRATITDAQTSTLFWVNLAVGGVLAAMACALAPALAAFYNEPRLFWITVILGSMFLANGAGAQHRALLQRTLKFGTLAVIDTLALLLGVGGAIAGGAAGMGYWALVLLNVVPPCATLAGLWVTTRWVPGRPRRGTGVLSMLRYGGTLTLNGVIVYLAYNIDKVLLGKFWGAEALGVYGRAYQLVSLPTESLNTAISSVAFPALSRVQNDPVRLREFFLGCYTLFLALVVPITLACLMFAQDIVHVLLGAKWHEAAPLFQLMSPTIFVFALINPFGNLMMATGHAGRSLRIALMIAPVVICGYVIGLRHGPMGVAAGFSCAMLVLAVPVMAWARIGSPVGGMDIVKATLAPVMAALAAAAGAWSLRGFVQSIEPALGRLIVESAVLAGIYSVVLGVCLRDKIGRLIRWRKAGVAAAAP